MARFLAYEHQLLRHPTIPERVREIIVLRLASLYRQDYEWKQHVAIARSIGMSEKEIEAARLGADQPVWSPLDRCVLRATEQMYAGVEGQWLYVERGTPWAFDISVDAVKQRVRGPSRR
jgi:alkylhydroperoxidase family enzyme